MYVRDMPERLLIRAGAKYGLIPAACGRAVNRSNAGRSGRWGWNTGENKIYV